MKTGRPSEKKRTPFGDRLAAARVVAGLSQVQVAKALGMQQNAYSWWERRDVALRADQIEKLLELLDITADELFPKPPKKKTPGGRAKS